MTNVITRSPSAARRDASPTTRSAGKACSAIKDKVGGKLGRKDRELVLLAEEPDRVVRQRQERAVRHLRAGRPPEHDGERKPGEERYEGERNGGEKAVDPLDE